jgi:hypothetical protein
VPFTFETSSGNEFKIVAVDARKKISNRSNCINAYENESQCETKNRYQMVPVFSFLFILFISKYDGIPNRTKQQRNELPRNPAGCDFEVTGDASGAAQNG